MTKLGIGVVKYNRPDLLKRTIERIEANTSAAEYELCVADDGSDADLRPYVGETVRIIRGQNRGVAWNKNRALFFLLNIKKCDVIILIEDDAQPISFGWEIPWVRAAKLYGHVNFAGDWFRSSFIEGDGTPESPIKSLKSSAQCCSFSREALIFAGLLDTRFQGFGFEHLEHLHRLIRFGYGGCVQETAEGVRPVYFMIRSDIEVFTPPSFGTKEAISLNNDLCRILIADRTCRSGIADEEEAQVIRGEMLRAMGEA